VKVTPLELPGVALIEPKVFGDARGYFLETWQASRYTEAGIVGPFVQDNISRSSRGVLRGLHLQHPGGQGKLVSIIAGRVLDVAVDLRVGSPGFGKWVAEELTGEDHRQLFIPVGCAHGFCVLSEFAIFHYKCTELYRPEHELGVIYNDPSLDIPWPDMEFSLSEKDCRLPALADLPESALPRFG
jgi:dTDP-4-dehydrorhamnose 3,5-epimerase